MADVFKLNVDFLKEGQKLEIDCGLYHGKCAVYTIRKGDTLMSIANAFGTQVKNIVALNNVPNPDRIMAGQYLVVPCDDK